MNDVAAATTDSRIKSEKSPVRIEDLIAEFFPIDQALEIKRTLFQLSLLYIRSERIEGDSQETRDNLAFHLSQLNDLVDDIIGYLQADDPDMEKLIDTISIAGWEDQGPEVLQSLTELSFVVIRSEEVTALSLQSRDELTNHLTTLMFAIDKLIEFSTIEQGE